MAKRRANLRNPRRRNGIAYIMAMLFLSLLTTLAVSFSASVDTTIRIGGNQRLTTDAQMAAEGGLSYICYHVANTSISGVTNAQSLLDAVDTSLRASISTDGMGGQSITYDGSTITIPQISVGGTTGAFSVTIAAHDSSSITVQATGTADKAQRRASVRFVLAQGGPSNFFEYGIATAGPITLTGNAKLRGANETSEASVFTACAADTSGVTLTGNPYIEGDVFTAKADVPVTMTGNSKIAGYRSGESGLDDHIHKDVGDVEFPEIDTSQFEALATNTITAGTSTGGNQTFTNVRILANTNKTFAGNIKFKGVVFIEQPNNIKFSGNLTVEGVVVTQDAGDNNYNSNTIKFTGNTTVRSPQVLPDEPQFAQLKALTGSFLLAPGFGVEFTGNFGTVSGTMAADKFTFHGNAGGTVQGSMISYSDEPITMTGNAAFYFDRSDGTDTPAGFVSGATTLAVDPTTYSEE